jgi:hypothetical protein
LGNLLDDEDADDDRRCIRQGRDVAFNQIVQNLSALVGEEGPAGREDKGADECLGDRAPVGAEVGEEEPIARWVFHALYFTLSGIRKTFSRDLENPLKSGLYIPGLGSMQISLNVSDDLAQQLQNQTEAQLSQILELGLRKLNHQSQLKFDGATEILEFLASLPTPEEIIALRPSITLQTRISDLLEKNRAEGLNSEEEQEWEQYEYLEHLVRLAKAKAHLKLKAGNE